MMRTLPLTTKDSTTKEVQPSLSSRDSSENQSALREISTASTEEFVASPTLMLLEEETPEGRCTETKGATEDVPLMRSMGTDISPPLEQEHAPPTAATTTTGQGKLRDLKKLYGRSHQAKTLVNAYEDAMQNGGANLVMIQGSVGMGKTVFAQSLGERVKQEENGFFMTWRFDHESQLESGDGFHDAFTSLRDQILNAGDDVCQSIRDELRSLGPIDCAIILGMIPMMEPIFGEAEADIDPFGVEASGRSLGIFKKMMRTFSHKDHPLVVLFDDVQFSDRCSHILLNELIRDPDNEGVLYIFAVGPEEPTGPIHEVIAGFEESVNITNIELDPLDEETTNLLIADSLRVEIEDSAPMSKFLYHHTKGNPYLVKEMLRLMLENGVLVFDEVSKTWHCNEERMDCVYRCRDFEALVRGKLIRLSAATKDVLKVAACLGTKIDVSFLDVILSGPVIPELMKAAASGLVIVVDEEKGHYRFSNNGIQQAVYALIPENEREAFNLSIGRKLLNGFTDEKILERLTLILRLIKRGVNAITSQRERYSIAALCVKAGQQAVEWSSFELAAESLDFGISLLGDRCWRDEYDLSLSAYSVACEIAYTIGAHEKVHQRADVVLSNARVIDHKLSVYCTKINSLSVTAKTQEAIDLGLDVLCQIGEPVKARPSTPFVAVEFARMRRFMRNRPLEKLRRLPTMTDHRKAAAMQVINLMAIPTMFGRPLLMPLLVFKAVQVTVTHGLCAISAIAFGLYGMVLAGSAGKYDEANQLAELSLELLERFDAKQWLPRVHVAVYGSILCWSKDLTMCVEPLQRGYDVGLETGDFEFALLNANLKSAYMFCTGTTLPMIKKEMDAYVEDFTKLNQDSMLILYKAFLFMVEALMESDSIGVFDRLVTNDQNLCPSQQPMDFTAKCWFLFKKMALAFLMGDFARAVAEADKIAVHKVPAVAIDVSLIVMFDALSRISYCKQNNGKSKRKTLAIVRKQLTVLKRYAKANPRFCLGMQSLVEAEIAAWRGKHEIATAKYLNSVSVFHHGKMLFQHGIASERAGKYMQERGKGDVAKEYLCESLRAFKEWGANGKCDALAMEIDEMYGKSWR